MKYLGVDSHTVRQLVRRHRAYRIAGVIVFLKRDQRSHFRCIEAGMHAIL